MQKVCKKIAVYVRFYNVYNYATYASAPGTLLMSGSY